MSSNGFPTLGTQLTDILQDFLSHLTSRFPSMLDAPKRGTQGSKQPGKHSLELGLGPVQRQPFVAAAYKGKGESKRGGPLNQSETVKQNETRRDKLIWPGQQKD